MSQGGFSYDQYAQDLAGPSTGGPLSDDLSAIDLSGPSPQQVQQQTQQQLAQQPQLDQNVQALMQQNAQMQQMMMQMMQAQQAPQQAAQQAPPQPEYGRDDLLTFEQQQQFIGGREQQLTQTFQQQMQDALNQQAQQFQQQMNTMMSVQNARQTYQDYQTQVDKLGTLAQDPVLGGMVKAALEQAMYSPDPGTAVYQLGQRFALPGQVQQQAQQLGAQMAASAAPQVIPQAPQGPTTLGGLPAAAPNAPGRALDYANTPSSRLARMSPQDETAAYLKALGG